MGTPAGRWVLFTTVLGSGLVMLDGTVVNVALERIGTYYSLRALYGVASSRSADGMSPETEPQRQQVREYFARYTKCDTSTGDDNGPDPDGDATRDPASRSFE